MKFPWHPQSPALKNHVSVWGGLKLCTSHISLEPPDAPQVTWPTRDFGVVELILVLENCVLFPWVFNGISLFSMGFLEKITFGFVWKCWYTPKLPVFVQWTVFVAWNPRRLKSAIFWCENSNISTVESTIFCWFKATFCCWNAHFLLNPRFLLLNSTFCVVKNYGYYWWHLNFVRLKPSFCYAQGASLARLQLLSWLCCCAGGSLWGVGMWAILWGCNGDGLWDSMESL